MTLTWSRNSLSELETVRRQTLAEVWLQLLGLGTVSEMREMLGLG